MKYSICMRQVFIFIIFIFISTLLNDFVRLPTNYYLANFGFFNSSSSNEFLAIFKAEFYSSILDIVYYIGMGWLLSRVMKTRQYFWAALYCILLVTFYLVYSRPYCYTMKLNDFFVSYKSVTIITPAFFIGVLLDQRRKQKRSNREQLNGGAHDK